MGLGRLVEYSPGGYRTLVGCAMFAFAVFEPIGSEIEGDAFESFYLDLVWVCLD